MATGCKSSSKTGYCLGRGSKGCPVGAEQLSMREEPANDRRGGRGVTETAEKVAEGGVVGGQVLKASELRVEIAVSDLGRAMDLR
jgi:hypothetical protein